MTKATPKLISLMNKAIASEIEASMRYLWQSILWLGIDGHSTKGELKAYSDEEGHHDTITSLQEIR